MNVVIKDDPSNMDSEQLAKCLETGADYNLYAASPMRAYMHGIDMEHWLRASANRIRTLTAEVERLRGALERIKAVPESTTALTMATTTINMMATIARNALQGGDDE